jgi:hypothetical protein
LKGDIAKLEARLTTERERADSALVAADTRAKAVIEKLEAVIATERERADCALTVERERANRAIAAFESLAQRLEAMAEAKRPLWHWLLWRG